MIYLTLFFYFNQETVTQYFLYNNNNLRIKTIHIFVVEIFKKLNKIIKIINYLYVQCKSNNKKR